MWFQNCEKEGPYLAVVPLRNGTQGYHSHGAMRNRSCFVFVLKCQVCVNEEVGFRIWLVRRELLDEIIRLNS